VQELLATPRVAKWNGAVALRGDAAPTWSRNPCVRSGGLSSRTSLGEGAAGMEPHWPSQILLPRHEQVWPLAPFGVCDMKGARFELAGGGIAGP